MLVVTIGSIDIESVVNENNGESSVGQSGAMCTACEMAVVWMQNQIKQNQTEDHILNYINQVKLTLDYNECYWER